MTRDFEQTLFPFIECEGCPIAKKLVQKAKDGGPYFGNVNTKLEKIALACIVSDERAHNEHAHIGGIRLDSLVATKTTINIQEGETYYVTNYIQAGEGNPPDFCPQLKK